MREAEPKPRAPAGAVAKKAPKNHNLLIGKRDKSAELTPKDRGENDLNGARDTCLS